MPETADSAAVGMLHAPGTGVTDAWYDYTPTTGMAEHGNLFWSG